MKTRRFCSDFLHTCTRVRAHCVSRLVLLKSPFKKNVLPNLLCVLPSNCVYYPLYNRLKSQAIFEMINISFETNWKFLTRETTPISMQCLHVYFTVSCAHFWGQILGGWSWPTIKDALKQYLKHLVFSSLPSKPIKAKVCANYWPRSLRFTMV